jgi:hypothetical protein
MDCHTKEGRLYLIGNNELSTFLGLKISSVSIRITLTVVWKFGYLLNANT